MFLFLSFISGAGSGFVRSCALSNDIHPKRSPMGTVVNQDGNDTDVDTVDNIFVRFNYQYVVHISMSCHPWWCPKLLTETSQRSATGGGLRAVVVVFQIQGVNLCSSFHLIASGCSMRHLINHK